MTISQTIQLMLVSLLVTTLSGCAGLTPPSKRTIDAVFNIPIKDPVYRHFTEATSNAQIIASGEFKPGSYMVKDTAIHIEPNTKFTLELSIPIDNPQVISTRNASGKLWTSVPLVVNAITIPQDIVLNKGKASGDVDLAQTLGAFFFNVLINQTINRSSQGDLREIIQTLDIPKAVLFLKPGSFLKFGKKEIHIGPNSKLELTDLKIDSNFNYQGKCLLQLKFLDQSKWIGERCDFDFNGGDTSTLLNIQRMNNELILSLLSADQKINLTDCLIKWGKNKRSSAHSAHCELGLQKFLWRKILGAENPSLQLIATMLMQNTNLKLITNSQETDAIFPDSVPCTLKVDINEKARSTEFLTHQNEVAKTARIIIKRPNSTVDIYLDDAEIGPLSVDKFGQMNFSLSKGEAKLKQLVWSTAKRSFSISTAGQSILSLPDGMELSSTGKPGGAHMKLPIDLKLGHAVLKGSGSELKLANLNGAMVVSVDTDVRITSDMEFSMENSGLIGGQKSDVIARGLDLLSANGQAIATIKSCTIDCPDDALQNAIKNRLPKDKIFTINKVIRDQKWRYKNATINTVVMKNLQLSHMETKDTNLITFTADGDLQASGTIDKGGIMTALTHECRKWETRPWDASGHVTGTGTVKYKLVPGTSLAKSAFTYDLEMQLPIPDDVDLNWDAVSKGLMRSAEKSIIISHMKKISIPLSYSGKLLIGDASDTQWKNVKITNLICKPSDKGTKMTFSAQAIF